jgi:ComF family protein
MQDGCTPQLVTGRAGRTLTAGSAAVPPIPMTSTHRYEIQFIFGLAAVIFELRGAECQRMERHMVYQWRNFTNAVERLAPAVCVLCAARMQGRGIICAACHSELPRANLHPAALLSAVARRPAGGAAIDRVICAYAYHYPVTSLIHQLKYQQNISMAAELGRALASAVMTVSASLPTCIMPVPLHRLRYIKRGFNQSLELANVVGGELGVTVDGGVLRRVRHTREQFSLRPQARRYNLRGAFKLGPMPDYESVAIVDDVITTGATVLELARLLKNAGVVRVEAWACARA